MPVRLIYFIKRALRNMRQTPVLCLASIGTVTVSLAIMAFFAIIVLNMQKLTVNWSKEIQVIAYMDVVPGESKIKSLKAQIVQMPEIQSIRFVDQREAYQRFKKRLGQNATLLEGVAPSVLPASFEISLEKEYRSQKGVSTVVAALKQNPHFSDLRYGDEWVHRFESLVVLLKTAGAFLGGFLLFATLFIVSNTIKLTLYARREELEIMALVGGTPLFIKTPFLLEGALQGALGGTLAVAGSFALFKLFLHEGLQTLMMASGISQITFIPPAFQGALIGAGTLLGFFGSLASLRKLVRV